jgi:hypothetical protein
MVLGWRHATVAVAVIAVGGCGGSSGSAAMPQATATQAYQAARDGVAKDNTRVALGTPVLVEIGSRKSKKRGVMEITVTGIDMGSWTDLGETQTADPNGTVPVYLRATIKNVGTTDLPGGVWTPDTLHGVTTDGELATDLTAFPPLDRCHDASLTEKQFKPGTFYQTCTPVLADPTFPVIVVQWTNLYFGTQSIFWVQ